MLIGYVSDERYVALADVLLDFEVDGQQCGRGAFDGARCGQR